jgi:hypothetical protein
MRKTCCCLPRLCPPEGADAGEPRILSIFLRLGGTNVRVSTNLDADHQVKNWGIATVSCRGKIPMCSRSRYRSAGQQVVPPLGLRPCPRGSPPPATRPPTQARSTLFRPACPDPCSDPHYLLLILTARPPSGGKASLNGDWACGRVPQQADQRTGPGWTPLPPLLPWPPTRSRSSTPTRD